MPNKSISEYAQLIEGIFQNADQSSDSQKISQAIHDLRDLFDQVKGQSKYASLVPVINEAMIELNSALVFNEIVNLQDNAKKLKPLISTLQGVSDEAKASTEALRLEKLELFVTATNEVFEALKEAKEAFEEDNASSSVGPKLQTAWEKIDSLLKKLKAEKEKLEK